MEFTRSQQLYEESLQYLPGGVNSPVRAFRAVDRHPIFIDHAKGAYLYDADGNLKSAFHRADSPVIKAPPHQKPE